MGCYNCKYLKISDKKDRKTNGSVYYCTKIKKYVNGTSDGCESHYRDYARKIYECDEIYNNGVKYSDDSTSLGCQIFILIVIIVIGIIVNIF